MGCGCARRSWQHLNDCIGLKDKGLEIPLLSNFPLSKQMCIREMVKLKKLLEFFSPEMNVNLVGKTIRVLVENTFKQYHVTKVDSELHYRLFELKTKSRTTELLRDRYMKGKIQIHGEYLPLSNCFAAEI